MIEQQSPNQSNPTFRAPKGTMWTYVPLNTIAHEFLEMKSMFNIENVGIIMAYEHPNTSGTNLLVIQSISGDMCRIFARQDGLGCYGGDFSGLETKSWVEVAQKLDDWLLGKILITQIGEWLKPAGRGSDAYGDPKTYKPIPLLDSPEPKVLTEELCSSHSVYAAILVPLFGSGIEEKDWNIQDSRAISITDKIHDEIRDLCNEHQVVIVMRHPAGKVVVACFWSRNLAQLKEIVLLNHFNDESGFLIGGRIRLSPKFIEPSNDRDRRLLLEWLHDKTNAALPKLASVVTAYPKEMFAGKTKENHSRTLSSHRAAEEEKNSLDIYFGSMQDIFLRMRTYLVNCVRKYDSVHLPSNFVDTLKKQPLNWEVVIRESLKYRQTNEDTDKRLMTFVRGILDDLVIFVSNPEAGVVSHLIVSGIKQILSDKDAFSQPRMAVTEVMGALKELYEKADSMITKEARGEIGSIGHFVSSIVPINSMPAPEEMVCGLEGHRSVLEYVFLRLAVIRMKKHLLGEVIVEKLINELSLMAHYATDGRPTYGFLIQPQRVREALIEIGDGVGNDSLVFDHMSALYSQAFQHYPKIARAPEIQSRMEARLTKLAQHVDRLYYEIFAKEPQQTSPHFHQPDQHPGFNAEQNFMTVNIRLEQLERQMQGLHRMERQMQEVIAASRVPPAPFTFGSPTNPFHLRGVLSSQNPWDRGPGCSL